MLTNLKRQDLRKRLPDKNPFLFLTFKDKAGLLLKSMLVVAVINYCFYRNGWMFLPLLVVGAGFCKQEYREILRRKKGQIRQQFKDMLVLTVTGQKAGYSVENAFLNSYEDLVSLYGSGSSICKMLTELKTGLENNLSVSELWRDIGESCEIEEILDFSDVFSIAKMSGGNMTNIMERTALTIESRAETQKEIETLLSAKRLEQKIMNVMPFILILYIDLTSPGYFDGLYHSPQGTAIMTFCLCIYLAAYMTGVKLCTIKV